MKIAKINNGVVTEVAKSNETISGWVEVPSVVGIGWLKNSKGDFQPPVLENPRITLSAIKDDAIERIKISHAEFLGGLTGGASPEERDTWHTKAVAAQSIKDGKATELQEEMIAIEADLAGEKPEVLVATILGKHSAYHKLIGLATGMKRKTEALIEAATTNEQVEEILAAARAEAEEKSKEWLQTIGGK